MKRGQAIPINAAVEAVLHVMDGSDISDVARKYDISYGHLVFLIRGTRRPHIFKQALKLYGDYRREQAGEQR